MQLVISVCLLLLLGSASCYPNIGRAGSPRQPELRSVSNPGQPNAVRTTYDISVLGGEAISTEGDVITLRSGQMIEITCKVTYERQLGKYFYVFVHVLHCKNLMNID